MDVDRPVPRSARIPQPAACGARRRLATDNPEVFVILLSNNGSGVHREDDRHDADHDERHATLLAAHAGIRGAFTSDQIPVNLFPSILNALTGRETELQPNLTFARVFDFTDVENRDRNDNGDLEPAPRCPD